MSFAQIGADLQAVFSTPAVWAVLGAAYLCGSVPFGYLLARAKGRRDIREEGSGNIGATNVSRILGKRLGLVTLAFDALKGALPVAAVWLLEPSPEAQLPTMAALANVGALVGHCFPVWLGFRGGKGVATGFGGLVAHDPLLAFSGVVAFSALFAATRVVSISSLVALLTLCPIYLALVAGKADGRLAAYTAMGLVIVFKHRSNLLRLWRREEARL